MTTLYLIRHGKTKANKEGRIIGQEDSPLVEESIQEIKEIAYKLKNKGITTIYASPLGRAQESAKIISQILFNEKNILTEERLKEINYGTLSSKLKEEVKKEYPKYHKDITFTNPKGESFVDLFERVTAFIKEIPITKEHILLVTHAGCIRAIYSFLNKEDFQKNINLPITHQTIIEGQITTNETSAKIITNHIDAT